MVLNHALGENLIFTVRLRCRQLAGLYLQHVAVGDHRDKIPRRRCVIPSGRRFRHGTGFVRWRPDKKPTNCTVYQLQQEARPSRLMPALKRCRGVKNAEAIATYRAARPTARSSCRTSTRRLDQSR